MKFDIPNMVELAVKQCDPHIGDTYKAALELIKIHKLPLDSVDQRHVNLMAVAESTARMEAKSRKKYSPDFMELWSTWLTYEAIGSKFERIIKSEV